MTLIYRTCSASWSLTGPSRFEPVADWQGGRVDETTVSTDRTDDVEVRD